MQTYAENLFAEFFGMKTLSRIQDAMLRISKDWLEKLIDDDDYQFLSGMLHKAQSLARTSDTVAARMPSVAQAARESGFRSFFPAIKKRPKSPDLQASYERRSKLASLNPMPSNLDQQFTKGQLAVFKVVADQVRVKGCCMLYLGEIAARAGVCLATARNAIREAYRACLLTIQERRVHRSPNKSNIIRIISADWLEWIKSKRYFLFDFLKLALSARIPRGGASKELGPTDKDISYPSGKAASRPYSETKEPFG